MIIDSTSMPSSEVRGLLWPYQARFSSFYTLGSPKNFQTSSSPSSKWDAKILILWVHSEKTVPSPDFFSQIFQSCSFHSPDNVARTTIQQSKSLLLHIPHLLGKWTKKYTVTLFKILPTGRVSLTQFSLVQSLSHVWLLGPLESQHARPPCPSPTPRVYPNSCPLSQWCHPTISSSVIPFSSCPQSFPASGSFQMSQLFTYGGQSIGTSTSASVPPMNTQDWCPLGWTGCISLQSKGLSRVFSNTTASNFWRSAFFIVQLSRLYMITGKTIALIRQTFVDKVMSLLFNMLYRLIRTFLPRSKHLLISWLQSASAVILEPPQN